MERKLRKYAMLYLADLMEQFGAPEEQTLEEFIKKEEYSLQYKETMDDFGRVDGELSIFQYGELEASFFANIAR